MSKRTRTNSKHKKKAEKQQRKMNCKDESYSSIPVDNNTAERAVKPFVIRRKNWLFSASPKGAEASAIAYSVIQTALANNLNVRDYLTQVFAGIAWLPF